MTSLTEAFHIEKKISVLVSPNDTEVHAGSHAVFRIQVGIDYDLLTVTWRHNNRNICYEVYTVKGSAWLSCNISSVSAADTGRYCVVIDSSSRGIDSETRCFTLRVMGTFLLLDFSLFAHNVCRAFQ